MTHLAHGTDMDTQVRLDSNLCHPSYCSCTHSGVLFSLPKDHGKGWYHEMRSQDDTWAEQEPLQVKSEELKLAMATGCLLGQGPSYNYERAFGQGEKFIGGGPRV